MEFANDNLNEEIIMLPDHNIIVKPNPQKIGYEDEFPYNLYGEGQIKQPKLKIVTASEKIFKVDTGAIERRVIDIINHCRYIAAKRGMDKKQLRMSIKQDELEGRNYLHTFNIDTQRFVSPLGIQRSSCTDWAPWDYNLLRNGSPYLQVMQERCSNVPQSRLRRRRSYTELEKDDTDSSLPDEGSYGIGPRPPTRRTATGGRYFRRGEEMADDFESSGDSDYDPSETSELLKGLNLSLKSNINERLGKAIEELDQDWSSTKIPPTRKNAMHNFPHISDSAEEITPKTPNTSSATEENHLESDEECEEFSIAASDVLNTFSVDKNLIGSVYSEDDSRDVIIQTARAHACASYAQLRQKWLNESQGKPVFGNFEEYMALEDSSSLSED